MYRAERIAKQADVVAALTIEVLEGVPDAFNEGKTSCYRYHVPFECTTLYFLQNYIKQDLMKAKNCLLRGLKVLFLVVAPLR